MGILISGLDEADCRDTVGPDAWGRHEATWCAPDALTTIRSSFDQVIWLYRVPWHIRGSADAQDTRATLDRWIENNSAILNARRHVNRLLLINVDRVPRSVLEARLDGRPLQEAQQVDQTSVPRDLAGSSSSSAQAALFAALFAYAAPRYWDVLETLEAVAWLPSGDPLVRHRLEVTEEALLALLEATHAAPATRARQETRIRSLEAMVAALQEDARQGKRLLLEGESEKQMLQQENDVLLLQLHQAQEELERYALEKDEIKKASDHLQDELRRHHAMQPVGGTQETLNNASKSRPLGRKAGKALLRLLPARIRSSLDRIRAEKDKLRQMEDLRRSAWFDAEWYLERHPDIREARMDPVEHYFNHGWKEHRDPSSSFDTSYYLQSNPDVVDSSVNPLWHFVFYGQKEGRLPRRP